MRQRFDFLLKYLHQTGLDCRRGFQTVALALAIVHSQISLHCFSVLSVAFFSFFCFFRFPRVFKHNLMAANTGVAPRPPPAPLQRLL